MQKDIDTKRHYKRKGWEKLPEQLNEFQKKVCNIIGIVGGGIYNAPINPEKIEWGADVVSFGWQRELSSFDFNQLTLLVFLCHEARIRAEIIGVGPSRMRVTFSARTEYGDQGARH